MGFDYLVIVDFQVRSSGGSSGARLLAHLISVLRLARALPCPACAPNALC